MSKDLWEEVKECVDRGVTGFQIEVTPGEVVTQTKKRTGKPRTRDPIYRYRDFADPRVQKNGGRSKPVCRGCSRSLRKNDILVCSDECFDVVKEKTLFILKYLQQREELRMKGVIKPRSSAA